MDVSYNTIKKRWRVRLTVDGFRHHIAWTLTKAKAVILYNLYKEAVERGDKGFIVYEKRGNRRYKVLSASD